LWPWLSGASPQNIFGGAAGPGRVACARPTLRDAGLLPPPSGVLPLSLQGPDCLICIIFGAGGNLFHLEQVLLLRPGSGWRVEVWGFGVQGLGFGDGGLGFGVEGWELRVEGLGFWVKGSGFGGWG
jgi:hypothetical protein